MNEINLHVHQSSGAARLLTKLTHITSGLSACATNVRLHASPTALDTLLPLDGSLCNFISFIGLVTTGLGLRRVLVWTRVKGRWFEKKKKPLGCRFRQPNGFNIKGEASFISFTLLWHYLPARLKWKNTSVRASELNLQQ